MLLEAETNKYCPGGNDIGAISNLITWVLNFFLSAGSIYIFPPAEQANPSWEYIIRSQTHECGNWDWGPDIPFLGIFVSNFRHFVFALHGKFVESTDDSGVNVRWGCHTPCFSLDSASGWAEVYKSILPTPYFKSVCLLNLQTPKVQIRHIMDFSDSLWFGLTSKLRVYDMFSIKLFPLFIYSLQWHRATNVTECLCTYGEPYKILMG